MYEELVENGASIAELLRENSGNVGSIGELMEMAADLIERQEFMLSAYRNPPEPYKSRANR